MSHSSGKYEAYVAADSAEDAIAVAAEALPKNTVLIEQRAEPADGAQAEWHVYLRFKRLEKEKGEY